MCLRLCYGKIKLKINTHITAGNIGALIVAIWIVGVTDAGVAATCQFSFFDSDIGTHKLMKLTNSKCEFRVQHAALI